MSPRRFPALLVGRTSRVAVTLMLALIGSILTAGPGVAGTGPTVTLTSSSVGVAGQPHDFTATLRDSNGPLADGSLVSLYRTDGGDALVTRGTTTGGTVVLEDPALAAGSHTYEARYDDAGTVIASPPVTVSGQLPSTLTLTGPASVVDGSTATLRLAWSTSDAAPVQGWVHVARRLGSGPWTSYADVQTGQDGLASLPVAPRDDSQWQATGAEGPTWLGATSPVLGIALAPIPAVVLPAAAPSPSWLPPQPAGFGSGANPVITGLPTAVWRSMNHRSWHRGCPVGRASLRLLTVNYWGFDGLRHRGEMVLNAAVVWRAAGALGAMYDGHYPIRRMYRVDVFGWSKRVRGANDYASMQADNTSGFNCRSVVNRPRVRSPHASGRAIDINTWENPYASATGLVPDSWWAPHSDPLVAWRSTSHPVVQIWRSWGFRWTYGTQDSQHMDGRLGPASVASFSG